MSYIILEVIGLSQLSLGGSCNVCVLYAYQGVTNINYATENCELSVNSVKVIKVNNKHVRSPV